MGCARARREVAPGCRSSSPGRDTGQQGPRGRARAGARWVACACVCARGDPSPLPAWGSGGYRAGRAGCTACAVKRARGAGGRKGWMCAGRRAGTGAPRRRCHKNASHGAARREAPGRGAAAAGGGQGGGGRPGGGGGRGREVKGLAKFSGRCGPQAPASSPGALGGPARPAGYGPGAPAAPEASGPLPASAPSSPPRVARLPRSPPPPRCLPLTHRGTPSPPEELGASARTQPRGLGSLAHRPAGSSRLLLAMGSGARLLLLWGCSAVAAGGW